jgi:hypothetical protein
MYNFLKNQRKQDDKPLICSKSYQNFQKGKENYNRCLQRKYYLQELYDLNYEFNIFRIKSDSFRLITIHRKATKKSYKLWEHETKVEGKEQNLAY